MYRIHEEYGVYAVKYALKNIFRMPKKSIPVFLMIFILLFVSSFGLFIRALCAEKIEKSFGILNGTVRFTPKNTANPIKYSDILDLRDVYGCLTGVYAEKSYSCELGKFVTDPGTGNTTYEYLKFLGIQKAKYDYVNYTVTGVTQTQAAELFYTGDCYIKEGYAISETDNTEKNLKVVISDKFAELNSLKIGDKISLSPYSLYDDNFSANGGMNGTSLTVGGIYSYRTRYDSDKTLSTENMYNIVYIPMSVLGYTTDRMLAIAQDFYNRHGLSLNTRAYELNCDEVFVKISDTALIPALREDIGKLGIYNLELTEYTSDSSNSAASRLSEIIGISMIFVIAVCFLIFGLVVLFGANSRKRELAVLCALGQSRNKTATRYFLEIFVIFLAALILTFAAFTAFVRVGGQAAAEYINSEKTAQMIVSKDALYVINGSPDTYIFEGGDDMGTLMEKYIIPETALTLCVGIGVLMLSFVLIYFYIRRLDIVTSAGGKE